MSSRGITTTPRLDAIGTTVMLRHDDLQQRDAAEGPPLRPRPEDIAEAAERLLRQYFGPELFDDADAELRAIEAAGMLYYAISDYGCSFEDIVQLGGVEVATLVAAITPDHRMPGPKREQYLGSQLSQASYVAQTLKLAHSMLWLQAISAALHQEDPEDSAAFAQQHHQWLNFWLTAILHSLTACHALTRREATQRVLTRTLNGVRQLTITLNAGRRSGGGPAPSGAPGYVDTDTVDA